MILPIPLLVNFLIGLLSLAFLLVGFSLLYRSWYRYKELLQVALSSRRAVVPPQAAKGISSTNREARRGVNPSEIVRDRKVWVPLAAGIALVLITLEGRHIVHLAFPKGGDEPKQLHSATGQVLQQPDGAKIHIETFGPVNGTTLVFTHGWGTSNAEWYYAKRDLGRQFRLIFWDLPGLGQSTQPSDRDFSLERMATDLKAVISVTQGKPVVLVGHSIGGMINLTFCRLFPDQLGRRVLGIAQVDTSYTNPVTTTKDASISEALQKPVAEPLLHAMILLSPLVRAVNWLTYQNGTSHIMNAQSAFAGSETWGQLDLISKYGYESRPAVVARGTLAMFHWDANPVLQRVHVPVLILVGQQDTTTLPSASEYMKRRMPQAHLEVISPSAHYGLLEQNAQYDGAIARFATTCELSTKP